MRLRVRTLASALLLAGPLIASPAAASQGGPPSFGPAQTARMRELKATAKSQADWLAYSSLALWGLAREGGAPLRDRPALEHQLEDGCDHLEAGGLAALAGYNVHPIISRTFEKRLIDGAKDSRDPWQTWAMADAAADCRDASWHAMNLGEKAVDCDHRIIGAASWSAGATSRSVFRLALLATIERGRSDLSRTFERGMRAGIARALGPDSARVIVSRLEQTGPITGMPGMFDWELSRNSGVLVVPQDAETAEFALASARALRILAIDARAASETDWEFDDARYSSSGWFPDPGPLSFRLPGARFDSTLAISNGDWDVAGRTSYQPSELPIRALTTRPPEWQRARVLARLVSTHPELRRVAIALPETGGNVELARAFGDALDALRRPGLPIRYAPGRTDYASEVADLGKKDAQAILLAGPPRESALWLRAIAESRLPIVVLGGTDLDPSRFPERERQALEGALVVGDEWVDRGTAAFDSDLLSPELRTTFGRGFRLGGEIARGLRAGAVTAGRLAAYLSDDRAPGFEGMLARLRTSAAGRPDFELPAFEVRHGALVSSTK